MPSPDRFVLVLRARATGLRHVPAATFAALAGVAAALAVAGVAIAASPVPSDALSGDPRSSGQGPGLVGDPAGAIAIVVLVAVVAVAVTLLYVRATGGSRGRGTR